LQISLLHSAYVSEYSVRHLRFIGPP